jgi:hypothetical protein
MMTDDTRSSTWSPDATPFFPVYSGKLSTLISNVAVG